MADCSSIAHSNPIQLPGWLQVPHHHSHHNSPGTSAKGQALTVSFISSVACSGLSPRTARPQGRHAIAPASDLGEPPRQRATAGHCVRLAAARARCSGLCRRLALSLQQATVSRPPCTSSARHGLMGRHAGALLLLSFSPALNR